MFEDILGNKEERKYVRLLKELCCDTDKESWWIPPAGYNRGKICINDILGIRKIGEEYI